MAFWKETRRAGMCCVANHNFPSIHSGFIEVEICGSLCWLAKVRANQIMFGDKR
jgi:hypothetical protein